MLYIQLFIITTFYRENKYVAIKALSGYQTNLIRKGVVWELEALQKLSASSPTSPHCLRLFSHFNVIGKGSAGEHTCFVTQLLGGDVKSLQDAHKLALPLPLAKRILLHMLRGIAHTHRNGVVHTDLKQNNIFFDTGMTTEEIDNYLFRILLGVTLRKHLLMVSCKLRYRNHFRSLQ